MTTYTTLQIGLMRDRLIKRIQNVNKNIIISEFTQIFGEDFFTEDLTKKDMLDKSGSRL